MSENSDVVVRVFLDALDDLARAVDDLTPAAAQARPSDRLNSISWVVAHVAQHMDSWVNVAVGQKARTEFLSHPQFSTGAEGVPPEWTPVVAALRAVATNARSSVQELNPTFLAAGTPYTGGLAELQGRMVTPEYRIARLTAHIYTHIGEILTARSILGLDVGSFPGAMPATMS